MTSTLAPGQSAPFRIKPIKGDLSPSLASLSNPSFQSSDPAVFTVAIDPANPNDGGILTALSTAPPNANAVLTGSATATEPDGTTTEQINGVVQIIVATPAPAPAAALVFEFGTPTP